LEGDKMKHKAESTQNIKKEKLILIKRDNWWQKRHIQ